VSYGVVHWWCCWYSAVLCIVLLAVVVAVVLVVFEVGPKEAQTQELSGGAMG